ncbi:MAG: TatD family hydrolase [Bacilli bacterium]
MLVDSHAHLNDMMYKDDLDKIIVKAIKNDVRYIIINGYDIKSSEKAIEIASNYDMIYATVGIHPSETLNFDSKMIDKLKELARHKKVVAIGEIGLDYHYANSSVESQKQVFKLQLELARDLNLPVTIHSRDAIEDTYEILKSLDNYGVMHCYSSSVAMANKFIDLGYYISLAGPVTFKNAKVSKEVAKQIPLENLLVETDSPYLTPHPYRGKRNDPSFVRLVAKEIAVIKEIDIKEVEEVTSANAKKLFSL